MGLKTTDMNSNTQTITHTHTYVQCPSSVLAQLDELILPLMASSYSKLLDADPTKYPAYLLLSLVKPGPFNVGLVGIKGKNS